MERIRAERDCQQSCLSMHSITENIYYTQLSSVAILLQPEPKCFTSYNTRNWLCSLPLCAIVFRSPPASHVSTSNGQWSSQLFCVYYSVSRYYSAENNYYSHSWKEVLTTEGPTSQTTLNQAHQSALAILSAENVVAWVNRSNHNRTGWQV
jgi:hypothetical protein